MVWELYGAKDLFGCTHAVTVNYRVTVSGSLGDEMPKGTFASVQRQAGLKRGQA
jgi:hypothetical protein